MPRNAPRPHTGATADAEPHAREIDFGPPGAGAHPGGRQVGYVYVVDDGGGHAFVLDTIVHPDARRRGLGVRPVRAAGAEARAHGARWLYVDYEAT